MEGKFFSTKRFGPISTGHRQWRAVNHCSFIHGYGRTVEVIFGASELDNKGWVVDFGALRDVKEWLEKQWDHRVLIAFDDPKLSELNMMHKHGIININVLPFPYTPGIEMSAKYVFDHLDTHIQEKTGGRCWVEQVRVWEHENNSALYKRP